MAVARADVESLSSTSWKQLDDTKKDDLLSDAETMRDTIFGGNVATLKEVEGDTDTFTKYLAAHLWTLAEGGEADSESSTGGSITYNTNPSEVDDFLSQTRYGEIAKAHLRTEQSFAIVTTR